MSEYEKRKQKIIRMNLLYEEYEIAIKKLIEELKLWLEDKKKWLKLLAEY